MPDAALMVAVTATSVSAAALAAAVVPPTPRLAARVRPYTLGARTSLGRSADVGPVAAPTTHGVLRRLFGPLLLAIVARLRRADDAVEARLARRLRQADLFAPLPPEQRVQEFRVRQVASSAVMAAAAAAVGTLLGLAAPAVVATTVLGAVAGSARTRGLVDRAIEQRRQRMQIELYTVNHLIAMDVRVGGGVVQAVQRVVDRGNGAVVDELAEILRAHGSGLPARDAFLRAAEATPEPAVGRTYRLLAAGAEYGADLARALLDHSDDLRSARRQALRRGAVRRRAAMLLPTIAILAPVMLLFIAAPLPSLIFGIR